MPEPRIRILPPEVAERIAAGEVVERPASAVKELVENALDAGAKRITVETEAGGKALIRVTDDGCGMTPEEVALAIRRHATSKLFSADDLFDIRTLGFRGEAMPSIAAVSEMEVVTRTPEAAEGSRILIQGGDVREQHAAAANVGTRITVRRLFYNVPVRERFLRSDVAEAGHVTEWLQRLALARSDVSFRLVHDGKEALLSPGSQDPLNAVVALLGRGVARELIRVEGSAAGVPAFRCSGVQGDAKDVRGREREEADTSQPAIPRPLSAIRVTGFVGRPTLNRANRSLQHTYVNGRSVRSPILYRALDDAFRSTMPHRRHPACVLFLEVPAGEVDVNVHPAKTEVRFPDEAAVHQAVLTALREALRSEAAQAPPAGSSAVAEPAFARVAEPVEAAYAPTPFADSALGGGQQVARTLRRAGVSGEEARRRAPDGEENEGGRTGEHVVTKDEAFRPDGERVPARTLLPPTLDSAPPGVRAPNPAIPELTYLGQTADLFLLAEGGGRLWIIDQHVAHERVLFDRLTAQAEPEAPELLLLAVTVDLDRPRALAIEEHREVLAGMGFAIEPFGAGRYALRSVPRSLLGRNYEGAFRDLADELSELSRGGQVRLRREEVAMAAAGRSCKRAVKAGQKLSTVEIERLLMDLREARNPHTCPHGRPVFLTYEATDLDRLFGSRPCAGG